MAKCRKKDAVEKCRGQSSEQTVDEGCPPAPWQSQVCEQAGRHAVHRSKLAGPEDIHRQQGVAQKRSTPECLRKQLGSAARAPVHVQAKQRPVFSCRVLAALGKQLSSDAGLASAAAVCKHYREWTLVPQL